MSVQHLSPAEKLELARDAMQASIRVRFDLGIGLEEPLCTYSACDRLGVPVRFVDISMEGIYSQTPLPRILLSAWRPLVRRHFNCAHELGHHMYGHGFKLDELQASPETYDDHSPEEFLANTFAGHLLMPVLGIRRAFARRKVDALHAEPHQILAIACEFGVSYGALATQLKFCLNDINEPRRKQLTAARTNLQRSMIGSYQGRGIMYLDEYFGACAIDVEENYLIVAPAGAVPSNHCVERLGNCAHGVVFKVAARGSVELVVPGTTWTVAVRATSANFIGLARYRFLEET
jgi:Zn-dependent peptidase ImmA (M78 family)